MFANPCQVQAAPLDTRAYEHWRAADTLRAPYKYELGAGQGQLREQGQQQGQLREQTQQQGRQEGPGTTRTGQHAGAACAGHRPR